ncbi:hypothetical protein [Shinella sp.]|uniref:hypothetical protein n=1 Tax=Shinella sp. TaxID=1870904 RepID=UPI0028A76C9C|nr:hypothetical protein [Shinella sp.]
MGDDASITFDSPVTPFEQKAKAIGAKGDFNGVAHPVYSLSIPVSSLWPRVADVAATRFATGILYDVPWRQEDSAQDQSGR